MSSTAVSSIALAKSMKRLIKINVIKSENFPTLKRFFYLNFIERPYMSKDAFNLLVSVPS